MLDCGRTNLAALSKTNCSLVAGYPIQRIVIRMRYSVVKHKVPVITIEGIDGSGKTEAALAVAQSISQQTDRRVNVIDSDGIHLFQPNANPTHTRQTWEFLAHPSSA